MKLSLNGIQDKTPWEQAGIALPQFDIQQVTENMKKNPTWVHFGAGNIFRAFPAAILQQVLDSGKYDRGVVVAEGFAEDCQPQPNIFLKKFLGRFLGACCGVFESVVSK